MVEADTQTPARSVPILFVTIDNGGNGTLTWENGEAGMLEAEANGTYGFYFRCTDGAYAREEYFTLAVGNIDRLSPVGTWTKDKKTWKS